MPTPLEILLDPVSLAVLAIYGALVLVEALFPARVLPRVPGWHARALAVFVVYFFLSSYLPLLWADPTHPTAKPVVAVALPSVPERTLM